jgi:hypothetical protein
MITSKDGGAASRAGPATEPAIAATEAAASSTLLDNERRTQSRRRATGRTDALAMTYSPGKAAIISAISRRRPGLSALGTGGTQPILALGQESPYL